MPRTDTLVPFDSTPEGRARASELGRRGAQARQRNREAKAIATVNTAEAGAAAIASLAAAYDRANLATGAAAAAQHVIARVTNGDIPIRHGGDAAELLRALVDIARLEEGQATSHVLHGSISAELGERITALQAQLAEGTGGSTNPLPALAQATEHGGVTQETEPRAPRG